jgi:hypothetical protein
MSSFFDQTSDSIKSAMSGMSSNMSSLTSNELADFIMSRNTTLEEAAKLCAETLLLFETKIEEFTQRLTNGKDSSNGGDKDKGSSSSLVWSSAIHGCPSFMAYDYLTIPPAMRPRGGDDETLGPCYDSYLEKLHQTISSSSSAASSSLPPPLLYDPPSSANVLFRISDRYGEYRGYIAHDGKTILIN